MKILIVEDNEDSRNLLMKQLRAYGHEVTVAADGAEALEQALVQPPDTIISDIMMPKMDGYQLCHELKQNDKLKDIPFIFYTATYTREEDEKFALSLGANTFIRKPTEPDILVQILCDVFEKAKAGALAPAEFVPLEPSLYLTEYNKRLISKLDKKVAQLQESEEKLKYIDSVLRAIRSINQLIVREKDRAKVLNGACEILIKVREYRFAWIGLVEEGHKRVLPVAQAGFEEGYLDSVKITWDDAATGKGPPGTAIKTRQPSLMRNIPEDPRFEPWRAEALKRGYLSSVAVPLVHDEKVYGALCVYSSERDGFGDEETGLLVEVSNDLAFALKAIDDEEKHQQAEEALKESQKFLQVLFDNVLDGILILDYSRKILNANSTLTKVLGLKSISDGIGRDVLEFVLPEFHDVIIKDLANVKAGRGGYLNSYKVRSASGKEFWVEGLGTDIVLEGEHVDLVAVRDVTERKRAEEKIKQTAEEWSTTFNSITDFVSICDKDFRLVRVNKAFADLLKKKPDELIGKPCHEMVHGTNEPVLNCPHKKTMQTKKPATAEFFEPYLGIHLEVATSPIFDEKGEVAASVHVLRDITERKKIQEQLIITGRLASVGELAAGIAHELNNPLTSVIGFSDLLLQKDLPGDVREDLQTVNREARRTADIIKNLLTFARKHEAQKTPTDINKVIENVLALRAYEQKVNNIEVRADLAPDLPEIKADGFKLQQIFLNIIVNAEYFMTQAHGKGTLTINTKRVGDTVQASFADDGPGIAEEALSHMFDPFFTTKEVGAGTGLGLSISHGIIAEHGGRIYAESALGKGATFVVELPITR